MNKQRLKILLSSLILLVSLFSFNSCATIMSRSTYDISLNTEPSNALVHVLNKKGEVVASGVTPTTVRLKAGDGYFKRASYALHISKDGYESIQYPLTASLDSNYIWNLFSWSIWGFLVLDPLTGAMWEFPNNSYLIPLIPKKGYIDKSNSINNNNNNTINNNIVIKIDKSDLK